jgi:exopolysaccharide biosynthesis operon protein EpsL
MKKNASSDHRALTPQPCRLAPLALALLAVFAANAQADELDTLQFRVGETVEHDSNVFRLSDTLTPAATQALIGRTERSDTIMVTSAGVKFNKAYSLQRFELDAEFQNYRYSRNSRLNFNAANYAGAWRWSLTPRFHGNITADRRQYVDNTSDVQNRGDVNRRTDTTMLADAEYEIGARWRALGGVFENKSKNSSPFTLIPDTSIRGSEVGARYIFREADSLAYRYRVGKGNYSNQSASTLPQLATSFDDREHEFRLNWAPSGRVNVQGRLAHVSRTNSGVPGRDFSGYVGDINANWTITGKTSLAGGFIKELNSYQTTDISYYDGYRFYVAPTYKPTEKIALRIRYDQGTRNYKGSSSLAVAPSGRKDNIRLASVGVEYAPIRALTLAASLQRDQRTSNTLGADYKNNSVFLSALFKF